MLGVPSAYVDLQHASPYPTTSLMLIHCETTSLPVYCTRCLQRPPTTAPCCQQAAPHVKKQVALLYWQQPMCWQPPGSCTLGTKQHS